MRRRVFLPLALVVCVAAAAWAQDPADATVYIRVIGDVRVLTSGENRTRQERLVELPRLELATGSGVIVSRHGMIVTNFHVIQGGKMEVMVEGQKLEVELDVKDIEAVLPRPGANEPARYHASVMASDAGLDLAVLFISAPDVPYAGLGDSDAVISGDAVRAIGYPLGDKVEIGKTAASVIPDASITSGSISAIRRDDRGDTRYLQTSAALNPGNSGGPLVDQDGHVVGIAQSVLKDATSVGFAIPINTVKTFLRERGLDTNLPAPLLALGPFIDPADRGVRLRIPEGYREESTHRLRVEASGGEPTPTLHIDRIATAATVDQIESALLTSGALEHYQASGPARRQKPAERSARRAINGWSIGSDPSGSIDSAMVYAIVDLGREKVVARYIGARHAIAMNRSVLQGSLAGMEVAPLLTTELGRAVVVEWAPAALPAFAGSTLPSPAGWVIEAGRPSACRGLADPQGSVAMSPQGDFTVQLRAAWWAGSPPDVSQAARACSPQAGPGAGSYTYQGQWWGETYEAHGVFVAAPAGLWHFEVTGPARKMSYVSALFERWVAAATRK